MCQSQHRHSQFLPRHPTDKIDHPPKNLPWTDKFCHFVMFEPNPLPKSDGQGRCVMRDHSVVIPAKAGIQKMDIGLPYSIPVHIIGRRSRELRCDRSLDSRLRGNDEHQTRLCHALSVPWLSALSPQPPRSVSCVMRTRSRLEKSCERETSCCGISFGIARVS